MIFCSHSSHPRFVGFALSFPKKVLKNLKINTAELVPVLPSFLPPALVATGPSPGLLFLLCPSLLHHVWRRVPLVAAHHHWVDDHCGVVVRTADFGSRDGHLTVGVFRGDVDFGHGTRATKAATNQKTGSDQIKVVVRQRTSFPDFL